MSGELNYILLLMISGISVGGIYALIGIGFVVIYKATKILNFAHGDILMIGAYLCLTLIESYHINFLTAFVLTLVFVDLLAYSSKELSFVQWLGNLSLRL